MALLLVLAMLLVMALGSGAVAQEPSPEPPPWFSGRVEMPEHGFAVTIPEDWVAFDLRLDVASQLEASFEVLEREVRAAEYEQVGDRLALLASSGGVLFLSHATRADVCALVAHQAPGISADAVAHSMFQDYTHDPLARDVDPLRLVDLPAGPAQLLHWLERTDPVQDVWLPQSAYILGTEEGLLAMWCGTEDARPGDDWLSIVETIEYLPQEE